MRISGWKSLWIERLRALIRDENLYFRFFALFLAVILWFLAGGEGRFATVERIVTVPMQAQALPDDFALITDPGPARVRIRSFSPLVPVAEREARAVINLSGAIEGEGTYGVDVTLPTGVDLVSVTPRWVRLRTERILNQQFPVAVALVGLLPEQGVQSLTPDPAEVVVRGPRSVLNQVEQVVAYISLAGGATRLEGNFPVRAVDNQGREIEQVTVSPGEVRVILQQVVSQYEQTLPIVPQWQGQLPAGLELVSFTVEPSAILVSVSTTRGDAVEQVFTMPIQLEPFEAGEFSVERSLIIPEGVRPLQNPEAGVDLEIASILDPDPAIVDEEVEEEPDVLEETDQDVDIDDQDTDINGDLEEPDAPYNEGN